MRLLNPRKNSSNLWDLNTSTTFYELTARIVRLGGGAERLKTETERIQAILDNFRDQIERSSNEYIANKLIGYRIVDIKNDKGLLTDKQAIGISFHEELGQSKFHHEYGIPECFEGIEVHLRIFPLLKNP